MADSTVRPLVSLCTLPMSILPIDCSKCEIVTSAGVSGASDGRAVPLLSQVSIVECAPDIYEETAQLTPLCARSGLLSNTLSSADAHYNPKSLDEFVIKEITKYSAINNKECVLNSAHALEINTRWRRTHSRRAATQGLLRRCSLGNNFTAVLAYCFSANYLPLNQRSVYIQGSAVAHDCIERFAPVFLQLVLLVDFKYPNCAKFDALTRLTSLLNTDVRYLSRKLQGWRQLLNLGQFDGPARDCGLADLPPGDHGQCGTWAS
ncbi:hypothetical protein J6590_025082 [Homalodisca vitripennis]|nr:hypothetical protein J6590_025082 [Homalodisca vitripennis]